MKTRQDILKYAKSLIGYTNYLMGAKWYSHNNNPNRPKLLDCSGFVVWCYKMAGFNIADGTYLQWNTSNEVKSNDLKIGDIGIKEHGGLGMYNHIGIYAGDGKWIHCNFSRNGVTLEKTNIFKFYRRFNNVKFEDDKQTQKPNTPQVKPQINIGDNEMITKGQFKVDNKVVEIDRILKNNENYVKIQDLVKLGLIKADYDTVTKIVKLSK